jgi:hypothetical protein
MKYLVMILVIKESYSDQILSQSQHNHINFQDTPGTNNNHLHNKEIY